MGILETEGDTKSVKGKTTCIFVCLQIIYLVYIAKKNDVNNSGPTRLRSNRFKVTETSVLNSFYFNCTGFNCNSTPYNSKPYKIILYWIHCIRISDYIRFIISVSKNTERRTSGCSKLCKLHKPFI